MEELDRGYNVKTIVFKGKLEGASNIETCVANTVIFSFFFGTSNHSLGEIYTYYMPPFFWQHIKDATPVPVAKSKILVLPETLI